MYVQKHEMSVPYYTAMTTRVDLFFQKHFGQNLPEQVCFFEAFVSKNSPKIIMHLDAFTK